MHNRKRRARTGCLTCRARRVKCDEQVPECVRCAVANVVCAGYEQQRVVVPVKPKDRSRAERQAASSSTLSIHQNQQHEHVVDILPQGRPSQIRSVAQDPVVTVIGSQVPLAAFPSGPHPSQCPSLGARHVLGYHQVLSRTIPMLFPPEHLQFWRDELLQKAWGCEFLYLTFVALGNVHRAALMTLTGDDRGRTNGLDMKITAVQLYTQALEGMAKHLEEAKKTPSVLVATLCLMAYFESFCGNIPAFIGRIQAANYYCLTLLLVPMNVDLPPLRDCLRSLSHNCYVTLPLDIIQRTTEPHLDEYCFEAMDPERSSSTSRMALESLINMISDHSEIKELMWSPIAAYSRAIPARTLSEFERKLVHWRDSHLEIIPELDTDSALRALLVYGWSQFAIPPSPYTVITPIKSLAAAYYSFFKARIRWALVLLDEDVLRNKPTAEFYFYEALRHAASHAVFLTTKGNDENTYMPCEALKVGLLPVLHISGLCSPQPLWLKWIHDLSDRISQEGVLKGHTFATSLDCLHKFEMQRYDGDSPAKMERYPDPAERIICQLIPETDGRHFVAYFAAPVAALDPRHAGLDAYEVIGDARWACGYEDGPCTPVVTVYDNGQTNLKTFSKEWLYNTQPVIEWLSWSQEREFCIERAVQDHISGTRLLLAAEGVINNKETET